MTLLQRSDHLEATGLRLRLAGLDVRIDRALATGLSAAFSEPGPGVPSRLLGARMQQLLLEGLEASGPLARIQRPPAQGLRLAALQGLEGRLRAAITDAAWILDADITAPVVAGAIDFSQVTVEHLGPNSALGVSPGGLYVDPPHLARRYLYLFTGATPQGLDFQGRGRADVATLVADLLARSEPPGRVANEEIAATLQRTQVQGELHLADGELGVQAAMLKFAGAAVGRNRLSLMAEALARKLVATLPEAHAQESRFAWGGLEGRSGAVQAELHLELEDLQRVLLRARRVQVSDLQLGDAPP